MSNHPKYLGNLDRKKMSKEARCAYEAYCSAKARSKKQGLPPPKMEAREFIGWWLGELKSFSGTTPTCGRINHAEGYAFDNIVLQDVKDNSREGMIRNKTNIKTAIAFGQRVLVVCKKSGKTIAEISSVRDAARIFGVSQRLVQFLIRGKYKSSKKINFVLKGAR